jgi:catechol 2,3-dioxygenase-like lactoylglutathione lyase family enzyme
VTPAAEVRIEHVALCTDDIERLAHFYSRYLGAGVGPRYANPARGHESRFLSFGSGALWCWMDRGAPETATMRVWFWTPTATESSSLSEPTTSKP